MKRVSHHKRTMVVVVGLLCLFLVIQNGNAYEFKVGGSGDWSLATTSYDQWARQSRIQIGDTLLFNYQANQDSVLQVSKDDYDNCSTASPIAKYSDGHTVIKLTQSGPHYFISGVVDHCKNNEKVVIVVMADRSNRYAEPPSTSPLISPTPAPAGEELPSPPPAPATEEINPSPAPSEENPPPPTHNSASSIVKFFSSIGAFVGFSILFVF